MSVVARRTVAAAFLLLIGLHPGASSAPAAQLAQNAYLFKRTIWSTQLIPVCWETGGFPAEKALVRRFAEGTWERESALDFVGWEACHAGSVGIRIQVADSGPHTKGLGAQLNGVRNGMLLNFTFAAWPCGLKRDVCISSIAVHEFGHALGFAHEQNRPDTPAWCRDSPQGTNGDVIIGDWDVDSVMNYCNPKYANWGNLSAVDVQALRDQYGAPTYKATGNGELLLAAAWAGDLAGVKKHLTVDTFSARSPEGLNALMMAADRCHVEIAQYILNSGMLSGPDAGIRNRYQNTALEIARGTDSEDRKKGLIKPRCQALVPMLVAFGGD